jgi:hypothetical protein
MPTRRPTKRLNLLLPAEISEQLQDVADFWGVPMTSAVNRLLRAGLLLWEVDQSPDSAILIREGDKTERLHFL